MTIPSVTPYPSAAPSRSDPPATFITLANAKVAHDIVVVQEMNTTITAINADIVSIAGDATAAEAAADAAVAGTGLASTCSSPLNVTTGAISPTLQTSKLFAANDDVVFVRRSDSSVRMYVTINTYNSGSGATTATVNSVIGSGTGITDWWVVAEPFLALMPATAAEVRAGTSTLGSVTPKSLADAGVASVPLTDAATIAWNMATIVNTAVVLGGNRTMGVPTNPISNRTYALEVLQDGTGSRTLSWPGTNYDWGAKGVPVLSTGAGKRDIVWLYCYDAVTPKFRCTIDYAA